MEEKTILVNKVGFLVSQLYILSEGGEMDD